MFTEELQLTIEEMITIKGGLCPDPPGGGGTGSEDGEIEP